MPRLLPNGWTLHRTGGNCTAFRRVIGGRFEALIVGEPGRAPERANAPCSLGIYALRDGAPVAEGEFCTLAAAIRAATTQEQFEAVRDGLDTTERAVLHRIRERAVIGGNDEVVRRIDAELVRRVMGYGDEQPHPLALVRR